MRVGIGYDVHKLVTGESLVLGGVEIDYHLGLKGHSDADVLVHSVIDALLGAMGKGDIGDYFPDCDPSLEGVNSLELLEKSVQLMDSSGYRINNIDIIIIAEKPKLAPYKDKMLDNLGKVLQIEKDKLNVKATTTEGLGFVGREEGIAARAVVAIE